MQGLVIESLGEAWRGRQAQHGWQARGEARPGTAGRREDESSGCARHGTGATREGRLGPPWRGGHRRGSVSPGSAGVASAVASARHGLTAHGSTWRAGTASIVPTWRGNVARSHGTAGQASSAEETHRPPSQGGTGHGRHREVSRGGTRPRWLRHGTRNSRLGNAGLGTRWVGLAGVTWQGTLGLDSRGQTSQVIIYKRVRANFV